MILADTSIWIDHLDSADPHVQALLEDDRVLIHAAVIGEIALGNLKHRRSVLLSLHKIGRITQAKDNEVLALIENENFAGSGIGFVDCHLVAATLLTQGCKLWTRDRRLDAVARRLGVAYLPLH
ncbi:MAG: type II toxin-antitoxin system VapC family toxin [Beijerinckiaceae bacterium]